jgi:hypothetical protein
LLSEHYEIDDTSEAAAGPFPASFGPATTVMAGHGPAAFDGVLRRAFSFPNPTLPARYVHGARGIVAEKPNKWSKEC